MVKEIFCLRAIKHTSIYREAVEYVLLETCERKLCELSPVAGECLISPQKRIDMHFGSLQALHCHDGFAKESTDSQVGTGRNLSPGQIA